MTNRAVPVWCMAADAGVFVTGISLRALPAPREILTRWTRLCRPFRAGVPGVAYPGRRPSQARDLPWAIIVRPVGAAGAEQRIGDGREAKLASYDAGFQIRPRGDRPLHCCSRRARGGLLLAQ
jgi:hypothetical protein